MDRAIDRRSFLARTAAAASALAFPLPVAARALGRDGEPPPSERITLGFIGVGGMGSGHLGRFLGNRRVEVLAVCDVDRARRLAARQRTGGRADAYTDYRELLARDDIDAVVIATPDHWHALQTIDACRAGKDVYCEKPLTLTIGEAQDVVAAARRYGRVVQTGSQQRSSREFRHACELVRNGCIGEVLTAEVGIGSGPVGSWTPDVPPPPGLDWDLWLGPAPEVPFNPARHPYNFRWFYDYSGGKVTDWGAHHNDIVQWAFGADGSGPVKIEGSATFPEEGPYDTAVSYEATYEYADGRRAICRSAGHGVRFLGTEGSIHVDRGFLETDPPDLRTATLDRGDVRLETSRDHHRNWLDCILSRRRPICDVAIGASSVTLCHLINIALRTGRSLRWNPAEGRFVGDGIADRWRRRPYRAPWRA